MSNPRLQRKAEWDGTFSLLLDGEVIRERRPLAEIEEAETYVGALVSLPRGKSVPTTLPRFECQCEDCMEPTLRDTGEIDPPSLR
jgi:hypothetical protein